MSLLHHLYGLNQSVDMSDPASQALAFAVAALQHSQNILDSSFQTLANRDYSTMGNPALAATSPSPLPLTPLSIMSTSPLFAGNLNYMSKQGFGAGLDSTSYLNNSTQTLTCDGSASNDDEDPELRISRNRERNREHARRTRLRKKAQVQSLQAKVKALTAEHRQLKQRVEECSIASILIGLGSNSSDGNVIGKDIESTATLMDDEKTARVALLAEGSKRCRRKLLDTVFQVTPEQGNESLDSHEYDGEGDPCENKTHISWKTGVYHDASGQQRRLSSEELETLRRERNRMHAKMTRDRKKCFVSAIEKTIIDLEEDIKKMRNVLKRVTSDDITTTGSKVDTASKNVTTASNLCLTPELLPATTIVSENEEQDDSSNQQPPAKRLCQGFT